MTNGIASLASPVRPITLFVLLITSLWVPQSYAAPSFPELTGRVVDEAGLLSPAVKNQLSTMSEKHEQATTEQIVIVTLKSLQGYAIEDYGYQLGRHWGIGQKDKDNGALFIVAPNEHAVRIEVGYGLEGKLTDALSHNIIQTQILPHFRKQEFEEGVVAGSEVIFSVLSGEYEPQPVTPEQRPFNMDGLIMFVIVAMMLGEMFSSMFATRTISGAMLGGIGGVVGWFIFSSISIAVILGILIFFIHILLGRGGSGGHWHQGDYSGGGRYTGGGFGGGGFRGGGGGFGGGGASGRW